MPPSSPRSDDSSGSCLIAHQTMQMSPISGIFRASISQTNPQVTSRPMLPLLAAAVTGEDRTAAALPAKGDRALVEDRHAAELRNPLGDLVARQPRDPLDAELLDVERCERGAVGHGLDQDLVADRRLTMGRDVAHEAAGERIARPG